MLEKVIFVVEALTEVILSPTIGVWGDILFLVRILSASASLSA